MRWRVLTSKPRGPNGIGLSAPPDSAFIVPKNDNDYWYTDFMDTEESQKLLKFQNHRFADYVDELKKALKIKG